MVFFSGNINWSTFCCDQYNNFWKSFWSSYICTQLHASMYKPSKNYNTYHPYIANYRLKSSLHLLQGSPWISLMMGHRPIISESKGPLGWGYGGPGGADPRPKMNFRFFTPPTCRYQLRVPKFYIVSIIPASFLSQVFDFMLMTDSSLQIYTLWITIFKVPTWGILLMQTRKWHFETCKMYFVEDQLFLE